MTLGVIDITSEDKGLETRILDGICYQNGYQDEVYDPEDPNKRIPNPESKDAFMKRIIQERILRDCLAWEISVAQTIARTTVEKEFNDKVVRR